MAFHPPRLQDRQGQCPLFSTRGLACAQVSCPPRLAAPAGGRWKALPSPFSGPGP